MAKRIKVALEQGPKGKKFAAFAPDWPGLERGAKTEAGAVEQLLAYLPRYAPVAKLAGLEAAFPKTAAPNVVERYVGKPSTDFWAISFAFSSLDQKKISAAVLERDLTLMRACWTFFDQVRARVSAELQPGPRGGGRNRDRIVMHVFANEQDWAKGVGVVTSDGVVTAGKPLQKWRDDFCQAIRAYHAEGKQAGKIAKWPLRYLIRHTAFHTLDHAWEMEDKDLTGKPA